MCGVELRVVEKVCRKVLPGGYGPVGSNIGAIVPLVHVVGGGE